MIIRTKQLSSFVPKQFRKIIVILLRILDPRGDGGLDLALIVPLLMNPSLRHRTFEQFGRTTLIGWESAQSGTDESLNTKKLLLLCLFLHNPIDTLYLCFSVPFPCLPTLSSMDFPDLIYPWITEVDRISSPSSSNIRWSFNSIPKAIYW